MIPNQAASRDTLPTRFRGLVVGGAEFFRDVHRWHPPLMPSLISEGTSLRITLPCPVLSLARASTLTRGFIGSNLPPFSRVRWQHLGRWRSQWMPSHRSL